MLRKLKKLWNKYVVYRGIELTPKGECFKHYCEQVRDNTLLTTIESYEDFIRYIQELLIVDHKIYLNRNATVEFILATYEEIL